MDFAQIAFAKLAALRKLFAEWVADPRHRYFDPKIINEYYEQFSKQTAHLRINIPQYYGDMPEREAPVSSGTTDFEGRGYIRKSYIQMLLRDIDYIFEVHANSRVNESSIAIKHNRIFISHGSSPIWREIQTHIERDLSISTLELAQEPNRGRTVLQKLAEESDRCSYAVIVMTGDDEIPDDKPRARQNVMHEIGYFQGKFGILNH